MGIPGFVSSGGIIFFSTFLALSVTSGRLVSSGTFTAGCGLLTSSTSAQMEFNRTCHKEKHYILAFKSLKNRLVGCSSEWSQNCKHQSATWFALFSFYCLLFRHFDSRLGLLGGLHNIPRYLRIMFKIHICSRPTFIYEHL